MNSFQQSEAIAEIATALSQFQGEIQDAQFDSKNPHFKSDYASLSSYLKEVRPVLSKHGLSIIQLSGFNELGHTMTTQINHKSGQWIRSTMILKLQKDDMQGLGSAITYARRYMVGGALGISEDDDDDAEKTTDRGAPKKPAVFEKRREEVKRLAHDPGEYLPKMGKYKGQRLKDLDLADLRSYVQTLRNYSKKKNEPLEGDGLELVELAEAFLTCVPDDESDLDKALR